MLISKSENEENQETAVHSTQPVCPNCGAARESRLEQVPSPASFVISFVSLFYFGIWCIFIIPLVFQSTKIVIKRCFYCNQELEKRNYFQLPNINDQILQFRFGNCIMVVSRKYALILLSLILCLFFYVEYFRVKEHPQVEILVNSNKTWVEFLQLCGKFQFVDNGLKARHQFETYFQNKVVHWKGDFVQTKLNHDANFPFNYWVYLKMEPTESTSDLPDLILGVDSSIYSIDNFQNMEKGKPLHFQAKFLLLGSEYNFHILELKKLQILTQEQVEDIQKINRFSVEMDKVQQLKRTKLQDSLKHMIHMYRPVNPSTILNAKGLIPEQIKEIENQIEQEQQQNKEQEASNEPQVVQNEVHEQQENEDVNEAVNEDVNEAVNEQFQPVDIKIDESTREEILSKDKSILDAVENDD